MSTPAWLTAKVDQKLALMAETLGAATQGLVDYTVVMTPLAEPPEDASPQDLAAWELSCDGCGKYCPSTLAIGVHTAELDGAMVQFIFGACPACRAMP